MDTTFDDEPTLYWVICVNDDHELVWHQAYLDSRSRAVAFAAMMHDEGFDFIDGPDSGDEDSYAECFYPLPDDSADDAAWDGWIHKTLDAIGDAAPFRLWLDEPAPWSEQARPRTDEPRRGFVDAVRAMVRSEALEGSLCWTDQNQEVRK